MSTPLSAIIITLNEEKNIGRCLESISGVVDEIVVVDSFSTDKTKEICAKYKAKFIEHPFEDFTKQKNFALSQCSHDWVLSLDADEALDPVLRRNILELKKFPQKHGFKMHRVTNYCGKWIRHGGWYPDIKLRLIDKRYSRFEGGKVHEKLITDQEVKMVGGEILHYSFYSIDQHQKQANDFSTHAANTLFEKGETTTVFRVLGAPVFSFFKNYFIKLGFLDGFYGLVIAVISAQAKFLKYAKLLSLHLLKKQDS